MAKKRSFTAKLAHEIGTEGKVVCPNCNTEVKRVKIIRNKKSKVGTWAPGYGFISVCKCNEADVYSGKIK